jgi:pyruvate formate lyase activating enzyme
MERRTKGGEPTTRVFRHKKPVKNPFPIVGISDLSIVDYPERLCFVIFVPGCNFRCPFCPNQNIINQSNLLDRIPITQIIQRLYPRLKFLDGVCISGGEPLIHRELPSLLMELKTINSLIKIDTNGSRPRMLRILLDRKLVDYLSMELITTISKYKEVTQQKIEEDTIKRTIQMIRKSNIPHEFKTTVVPGFHDVKSLEELAKSIAGSRRYVIKQFDPSEVLDPICQKIEPYSNSELRQIQSIVAPYFYETEIIF